MVLNNQHQHYSVLMSVYFKENPEFLRTSINSMWNQTVETDDFVLVCDGPLTKELNSVIDEAKSIHLEKLHIIRLDKNVGLGKALNIGIKYCSNNLVARMDSDDISRKDRCEKQINIFNKLPNVSIVSGIIEEFEEDLSTIYAKRELPELQSDIIEFAKRRNPFNHPCVMYKKADVETAGGYQDFYLLEDYFLWIRMLQKGFIGYNIQEPLLWMRGGTNMYKRRSGLKYVFSQKALFKYMFDYGFITRNQYYRNFLERAVCSLMPNWSRRFLYKFLMRKT